MATEKNDLGPRKGETAEEFKDRILDTQREMKREAAQAVKPAEASASTATLPAPVEPNKAQVSAPDQTVVSPDAEPKLKYVPATGNPEVDEWWQKKGFKSAEDAANSIRELERELNRKNQELANRPSPAPVAPPPTPSYPPYYPAPVASVPPPYTPPPPQPVPQANVEQLARQYGLDPNDFEKVAAVANDLAQSAIRQELNRVLPGLVNRVQSVDREVAKNREMVELMADPAFKNPQVQFEMHRVMEADPTILSRHTTPYRFAFNEALIRVARAKLGGPNSPAESAPTQTGSRPPTTAGGNGNGGTGAPQSYTPDQVNPEIFARMSLAEKRDFLKATGRLES